MEEKILIVNAGSSSLKFSLCSMPFATEIVSGLVEKIGEGDSFYSLKFDGKKIEKTFDMKNHKEAVEVMLNELKINNFIENVDEITAVGHRVVHGGEFYSESVVVDDDVLENIKGLTPLAPLHVPGSISGIESMKESIPNAVQVAVFDTAFHQTIPEENYMYATPYSWYEENGVRKYGFHGTSHKYITEQVQEKLNKDKVNAIILHIGSGVSMSCIKDGKSYDTTMGMTPLDGVIMGTRSGSIDPSIVEYMCKEKGLTVSEVTTILNKESGLKGICGKNDFRDVNALAEAGDRKAKLAITLFEKSLIKYIAQYYFELNGNVDAIVFTAGIGENMASVREDIIDYISEPMGIELNRKFNNNIAKFKEFQEGIISTENSKVKVMVIPTNEEYMILKDTYELSKKKNKVYRKTK